MEKRTIYFSLWVRLTGKDYENHIVGTKMGFFAYGRSTRDARNESTFMLSGTGRVAVGERWRVQFNQQFPVNRNFGQNLDRTAFMTVGVWHHWEAILELNEIGHDNGTLRMWIDGHPVMEYRNVRYVVPGSAHGFNLWKWNPTWGGMRGVRSRDDLIDIDDVYLSSPE